MEVEQLGNRVLIIYALTIITGTVVSSFFIAIFMALEISGNTFIENFFTCFFSCLLFGGTITIILCIPLIFILYFGIKYIYKSSRTLEEKNKKQFILWLIIGLSPSLLFMLLIILDAYDFEDILASLMPVPYSIASYYFIKKINNDYDKKFPYNFNKNEITGNEDILDADL